MSSSVARPRTVFFIVIKPQRPFVPLYLFPSIKSSPSKSTLAFPRKNLSPAIPYESLKYFLAICPISVGIRASDKLAPLQRLVRLAPRQVQVDPKESLLVWKQFLQTFFVVVQLLAWIFSQNLREVIVHPIVLSENHLEFFFWFW